MTYKQLTVLIPSHGIEDLPTELSEKPAASLINAFASVWHPRLIAESGVLPRWQRGDSPFTDSSPQLFVVPTCCDDQIPEGWIEQARSEGNTVVRGEVERDQILSQILEPLGNGPEVDPELVADFLAFGTTWLLLHLLTQRMRSYSNIDEVTLQREMVSAAQAALHQDDTAARTRLRGCYEMLQEARERFYPVECFLLDLCLVTPDLVGDSLRQLLQSATPVNLHATAGVWQEIVDKDQQWRELIRQGVSARTVELIGGDDQEVVNSALSLNDTLWHLRTGRKMFETLFEAVPRTWGRKRFGLGAHLPQLLNKLGYQGALHLVMDDGLYPDQEQSHFKWEGPDGSKILSFSRIPIAADSAAAILRFPDRMSESMDLDYVAATMLVRWPEMRQPFLNDLRRAHTYAPVLGHFVRFEDYFERAGGPGRHVSNQPGQYLSPGLVHSVAARESDPVSRFVDYWNRERTFDTANWLRQITRLLKNEFGPDSEIESLEKLVREAHPGATSETKAKAQHKLDDITAEAVNEFRAIVASGGEQGEGVLIINPLSFPRKAVIDWPTGTVPVSSPHVLGIQNDEDRVCVLVDLPPCGFVWIGATAPSGSVEKEKTTTRKIPMAEDLVLRNELFEVRMSDVTGGIAGIHTYRRSPNRISQQIALRFGREKVVTAHDGDEPQTYKTFYTSMQLRESRVLSSGPLVGEIETVGDLIDDHLGDVVATYRQRTRVIKGLAAVQVDVEVAPAQELLGDPWTNYLGCRFAWKYADVALTASLQQGAHKIVGQRVEAPQFIEIADEAFRTTIMTPGLPFHRMTGERMLDTLMIVEGETVRRFSFSIGVDLKYPMQASLDQSLPPLVVRTKTKPAGGSRVGWFLGLSAANVQITGVSPSANPRSLVVRLLETEGRGRSLRLECFRSPQSARTIDFRGETITPLRVDEAVNLEIGPYELCDVELTF